MISQIKLLQDVCTLIAVLLNVLLVYLIVTKSPKTIGTYKYLMVYIAIFEIIYSVFGYLLQPVVHSFNSRVLLFQEIKTTKFIDSILIAIYGGLYACSIALLGVHFIYRYGSLDSVKKFRYFEGYRIIYWGMIPVIFTVFWSFIAYFIFPESSEYNEVIRAELLEIHGINIDTISYIGEYLFDENTQGIQPIMLKSVIGLLLHSTMISASMFTVFYFGYVCYLSIRKSLKSNSKSTPADRLQRQFFYALVVQTVVPLICLYIPILIAFSCAITLQNIGGFSNVVTIGMTLYPALDPLPTLLIVKSYRNALFNNIFRGKIIRFRVSSATEPSKTFHRGSIVNKI